MGAKQDLTIDQGTTFSHTFLVKDANGDAVNLTGYAANSVLREWYTSCDFDQFTTTINATAGSITLSLTPAQSLEIFPKRYVYDVELTDAANNVTRPYEGIVTVTPAVTR